MICVASLPALADFVSLAPAGAEPRVQLTGEYFQIYSNGAFFTDRVPGATLSRFNVLGTDLGYPLVYPDKIVFFFGDTMAAVPDISQNYTLVTLSGANDSVGFIPNQDLDTCHYIRDVDAQLLAGQPPSATAANCPALSFYANPNRLSGQPIFNPTNISGLLPGEDLNAFETPSGAFDVNGRVYLFYITKAQDGQPHFALQSILARADQPTASWSAGNPPTFTRISTVSTHPAVADPANPGSELNDIGKFMFNPVAVLDSATMADIGIARMLPASLQGAANVVFVFGSSWRYDRSGLYVAAFALSDVEAGPANWWYYAGSDASGAPKWTTDERSAAAVIDPSANIGNHSVAWVPALRHFVVMSNHVGARFATTPWGPWSDPITMLGPTSKWASELIHHPGQDPISRSVVPIFLPNGMESDLNSSDTGVPYGPYIIGKYTQNADGSVTVFYTMSTWNPYEVFLVSSTFQMGVHGATLVSSASYVAGSIAPGSIATIFGSGLSDRSFQNSTTALPTKLGDVSVTVKDSAGVVRTAPLYFVGPGQINFVVPDGSAAGPATVTIIQGSTSAAALTAQISPTAPALYSAGGNGSGPPAGFLVGVNGSVTTLQPLFTCPSGGVCVPSPVDAYPSQQNYLELFGTGIRGAGSASAVKVTVGGIAATTTYAGPQGTYPGLDQINALLTADMQGKGLVDVVVTIDGNTANTLRVYFR